MVDHELLPSADDSQVGVVGVASPTFYVWVVRQGRLVAVGVEPSRQTLLRNARAVRVGQDQSSVELGEHSPSSDSALFAAAQVQLH